jgi:TonB family protein
MSGNMNPDRRRNRIFILFLLMFLMSGCTYYNTFYNAKKAFKDGERAQERVPENRRHSAGKNHYEAAIKKASKVLTFHPKSKWADDALFMIGRAYFNMGEYVKARRKFEELQTSFPKSKLVNDSHYYISMCHYFSGEEIGAISSLRHLLESEKIKKKRKAELSFFMGEIYFNRKEFGEAITYYEKILNQYDPDTLSAITRLRIGECLWEKKDYVQAKEAFTQVEESDPSPELLFDSKFKEGECHYILGEHQEGMKIYKELSDDNRYKSKLASIKLKIAEGYYALDELSLSMEEYLRVTEDYPRTEESAEAYFQLGRIYQEVFGDLQLAKGMYGKCSDENPRSEIAKKALTQSANISRIEEYQQLISVEETEKSAQPQFLLAELYLTQMNEPDSALTEYLDLADQFPESEYAAKSLYAAAWIYEKVKGDTNQAARTYQRILDEYPQSDYHEIALESLGNSTDSLGLNNAEDIYQKAERFLFQEQDVDSALAMYDMIIQEFPHSLYASKSAYAKAWTMEYYANPGDSTVIFAYQNVIDQYPGSEYAEEARIKLGLSARRRPTQPEAREATAPLEEEKQDTTETAGADTTGPGIPKAPEPLQRVEFVYPESEILSGIQGAVVFKIRIEFDGTVSEAQVVNSLENPWIDDAAKEVALKTSFDPEKLDPMQVGGWFLFTVEVKLPQEDPLLDPTYDPNE